MKYKINFAFDYVFPTFILPNATMTELGIVNYMASMHSLKAQNATAFEQYISLGDMFDNQLGTMPNSGTGYFYQAQVYGSVIDYTENALYFTQRNPNGFIYLSESDSCKSKKSNDTLTLKNLFLNNFPSIYILRANFTSATFGYTRENDLICGIILIVDLLLFPFKSYLTDTFVSSAPYISYIYLLLNNV